MMAKRIGKNIDLRHSWDTVASHYRERYQIAVDDIHYGPLCAGERELRLLGDLRGKKILDLGCGGGQNAIAMAQRGAAVSGIDFSASQIEIAKAAAVEYGFDISFRCGDIVDTSEIKPASYDMIISACAISFVENIKSVFDNVYRMLRTGGVFILSDMHPLQYIVDEDGESVKFNNTYPFEPILMHWKWDFENIKDHPMFKHYVRSIACYSNSLVEAGFKVVRILEPEPTKNTPHRGFSEEIIREYPYIARHLPITFIMDCIKPEPD